MELTVLNGQFVVRQPEIAFQPLQKGRFKNSAASVERVACQPDQLRPAQSKAARVLHLVYELLTRKHVSQANRRGAVEQGKRYVRFRIVLPDELEHQQFIKISVEQGPCYGIEFPVVVVRPLGEVHDHGRTILCDSAWKINRSEKMP